MNNKFYIFTTVLLILIVTSLVILSNLLRKSSDKNKTETSPTITITPVLQTPTPVQLPEDLPKGQSIQNVPTLNPSEGMGLDLDSPEIQNSINEINKIKSKLPYKKSFTSGSGLKVDILIPSYELLDNEWTLIVNIQSLDYEISEQDPQYAKTKDAFRQSALDVFFWLKDNGVDTQKIIIKWGDREFIQKRSEEWLK